jgi:DNA helicase-2/ATP-dependent DNA helicase PcrA
MAEILKDLNPEQKRAVTHKEGPLLVIAGAGTGKTTVITRRIAWLIAEKMAKPGEILALTFTDKAAEEMESRVDLMVPYGYIDISISTFHAFGDRVLRDYAIDLGLRPDYRVLPLAEQIIFFREHIFDFPLKYYKSLGDPTKHIEALINAISRAKDEDISPEEYLKWGRKGMTGRRREKREEYEKQLEVAKIYKKYQELKAGKGFVDFGDQVTMALKLFREHPSVLEEFQARYKFILVDEFQDTNYAQFELLKLLAGKKTDLTVVADDDQAIYRFRGAAINNVLNFEKHYKKSKKIVLIRNYRSTQIILDAARRLIRHNDPERLEVRAGVDKRLVSCWKPANKLRGFQESRSRDVQSQAPYAKRVEHRHFDKFTSEADWVAQTIKEKKYPLKDYAILVRSNADAEPFRQSLNMLGIPHQFSGGGGLYVSPEVKLAVAFLRVIGDLTDSVSLYDLALSEIYQLNPLDLQKMSAFASRRNLTLHHVFTHLDEFDILSDIKKGSRVKVRKIMDDIQHYLGYARERTTGEVLHQFLKRSGHLSRLTGELSAENEYRLKNLAEFFDKVRQFKEVAEIDRVSEFVKYLNILREAGDDPESARPDSDVDAVNIMTVHKAKGLEFPVVFLVSLVADKFPVRGRKQPIELPDALIKEKLPPGDYQLMEERRLFYVGMTRAGRELYLTSSVDYGGKRDRKVSPFVLEALDLPKADIAVLKQPAAAQIELFGSAGPVPPRERKRGKDEIIPLSYYQIDDYLTCPLKYQYVHVLRVPLLPNHQILYGSAMHQAVQAYFLARKKRRKFSEKQLLDTFKNNWSSEGFISRQHEEQRFAAGKKALQKFYKAAAARKRIPRYVEEEFSALVGKVQLRGRWDLIEEGKGKTYIVDFKSSEVKEQKEADRRVKESLQLAIYALVWKEMFNSLPDFLELYFLETGMIGSVATDKAILEKTREKIQRVADGIRQANFRATPGFRACTYCPYNEVCPSSAV